ncbi:hypothetical protein [Flagellimonas sp. W118]|uniref:hypothetical protein n=1 Tax=Flagellimonas sp. W118 TaxID=3410791 RepID=UPI003BF498A1
MAKSIPIATIVFLLLAISCNKKPKTKEISQIEYQKILNPDPINAMNNPSKHAWDLFLQVNHPAKDFKLERGVPDLNKKIGDPGIAVWETWKHAGSEVFLDNGGTPPVWEDFSLDPFLNNKGKTLEASTSTLIKNLNEAKVGVSSFEVIQNFTKTLQEFHGEDGIFGTGGGETRMNKSTFDFIVENELYNTQGLYKFREDYLNTPEGKREPLAFDKESIEVKAMWRGFSQDELDNNLDNRFYVATDSDGKKYGLTSLHIITKDVPNWFWCSFRQIDGKEPQIPEVDNYGPPKELKGTFWEYYKLSGTQTTFTDPKGDPSLLSDTYIEDGFEHSSCISCHSLSVVGGPGSLLEDGGTLLFVEPHVIAASYDGRPGQFIGTPEPEWFKNTEGKENLIPLDFVYSLSFRAKPKK